jgi:hypothetical protein
MIYILIIKSKTPNFMQGQLLASKANALALDRTGRY